MIFVTQPSPSITHRAFVLSKITSPAAPSETAESAAQKRVLIITSGFLSEGAPPPYCFRHLRMDASSLCVNPSSFRAYHSICSFRFAPGQAFIRLTSEAK